MIPGELASLIVQATITGAAMVAARLRFPWVDVLFRSISAWWIAAFAGAALMPDGDVFWAMRALGWAGFVWMPLLLLTLGVSGGPRFTLPAAPLLWAIAARAAWWEPTALEVSYHELRDARIDAPIRVVVLSDIQTDAPGDYERQILEITNALAPDLVLLPGDYLQIADDDAYTAQAPKFRALFQGEGPEAELGAWAVAGNMEWRPAWPALFDGTWVAAIPKTRRVDTGPIVLTALSFIDGFDPDLRVPPEEKFHLVFAHGPDYALGDVQADLLIAGHTHGGQVNLPGFGPLLTFSEVPRDWAAGGMHEVAPGRHLIVSRGLGMERHNAPRIRLNCRPEIVVIDLLPPG